MTWLVNQGSLPMLETFDPYISSIFPKTPKKGGQLFTAHLLACRFQTSNPPGSFGRGFSVISVISVHLAELAGCRKIHHYINIGM